MGRSVEEGGKKTRIAYLPLQGDHSAGEIGDPPCLTVPPGGGVFHHPPAVPSVYFHYAYHILFTGSGTGSCAARSEERIHSVFTSRPPSFSSAVGTSVFQASSSRSIFSGLIFGQSPHGWGCRSPESR